MKNLISLPSYFLSFQNTNNLAGCLADQSQESQCRIRNPPKQLGSKPPVLPFKLQDRVQLVLTFCVSKLPYIFREVNMKSGPEPPKQLGAKPPVLLHLAKVSIIHPTSQWSPPHTLPPFLQTHISLEMCIYKGQTGWQFLLMSNVTKFMNSQRKTTITMTTRGEIR